MCRYFDADAGQVKDHAIRIHHVRGVTWAQTHILAVAGIAVSGAGVKTMISTINGRQDSLEGNGARWCFCGGVATTLLAFVLQSLCHRRAWWALQKLTPPQATDATVMHLRCMRIVFYFQVAAQLAVATVLLIAAAYATATSYTLLVGCTAVALIVLVALNLVDEVLEHERRKEIGLHCRMTH